MMILEKFQRKYPTLFVCNIIVIYFVLLFNDLSAIAVELFIQQLMELAQAETNDNTITPYHMYFSFYSFEFDPKHSNGDLACRQ